jgi:hypothetical protein
VLYLPGVENWQTSAKIALDQFELILRWHRIKALNFGGLPRCHKVRFSFRQIAALF